MYIDSVCLYADFVAVGVTFAVVILVVLVTLVITRCHFIGKPVTVQKCVPGLFS